MRIATYQVFDQVISGTTPYYSGAEYNVPMAQADFYGIQAVATNVLNSATLQVAADFSPDNQNWISTAVGSGGAPRFEIPNGTTAGFVALTNNGSLFGSNGGNGFPNVPLGFFRLVMTLGAANHSCRLKVYFTGHARSLKG
jgi:hypothetical protein